MSMRNYAVYGYGVILNGKVDSDILAELAEDDKIDYQYSFTGEAFDLLPNGCEDWGKSESFNDETLYFVGLPKYPQLFKAAYKNMKELVADMQKRYNAIKELPKLKIGRQHVKSFSGTYYG